MHLSSNMAYKEEERGGCIFTHSYLPVNPTEDPGIGWMSYTVGNPVRPVLCEPVLLGNSSEPTVDHSNLHDDILLVGADVVSPQCGERFIHTSIS